MTRAKDHQEWRFTGPDLSARPRMVVVAATFNNAGTLERVLDGLDALGTGVIVVNDGSTDDTAAILRRWEGPGRWVVTHPINQGKAAALREGFRLAEELGFTHALTIDTDGQHDPADAATLWAAAQRHPDAFILGMRPAKVVGCPRRSRMGRRASNALIAVESGLRVADSQCGLRVYPLTWTRRLLGRGTRYAFETEILTRIGWARLEVIQIPVGCVYQVDGTGGRRVSHFRPWGDSLSAAGMHARLLARSLLPGSKLKIIKRYGEGPTYGTSCVTGTMFDRTLAWINPLRVWRRIRADPTARRQLAASLGVGVFMALMPIYGVKTIVCLALAKWLRLEPLAVVGASSLSTPPIGPVLIVLSIAVGHLLLRGNVGDWSQYDPAQMGLATVLSEVLMQWILGSIVCGVILGGLTYLLAVAAGRRLPLGGDPLTAGEQQQGQQEKKRS